MARSWRLPIPMLVKTWQITFPRLTPSRLCNFCSVGACMGLLTSQSKGTCPDAPTAKPVFLDQLVNQEPLTNLTMDLFIELTRYHVSLTRDWAPKFAKFNIDRQNAIAPTCILLSELKSNRIASFGECRAHKLYQTSTVFLKLYVSQPVILRLWSVCSGSCCCPYQTPCEHQQRQTLLRVVRLQQTASLLSLSART